MKYFIVLILTIIPIFSNAFTIECPGKVPAYSFKIELQEEVKSNSFGALLFPENAAVNVTETLNGFARYFSGNIIFQESGGIVKHGRMAHYIFKLKESNQWRSSFDKRFDSLVLQR